MNSPLDGSIAESGSLDPECHDLSRNVPDDLRMICAGHMFYLFSIFRGQKLR